jgi:hypothetical protein
MSVQVVRGWSAMYVGQELQKRKTKLD